MSGGLGIDAVQVGENWDGLSAWEHRQILSTERTVGIVKGCKVTTDPSGLYYYLQAGAAATSRSADDGVAVGWQNGSAVGPVAVGGGLPRVDTIYAIQMNKAERGTDPDNNLRAYVISGTPHSSPQKPVLPVGAVELGSYRMPAGGTTTGAAAPHSTGPSSLPLDASLGLLFEGIDTNNGSYGSTIGTFITGTIVVPTKRRLDFRITMKIRPVTGNLEAENPEELQMIVRPVLDGVAFSEDYSPTWHSLAGNWFSAQFPFSQIVEAGTHTVGAQYGRIWGDATPYGVHDGGLRKGTTLNVIDGGFVP